MHHLFQFKERTVAKKKVAAKKSEPGPVAKVAAAVVEVVTHPIVAVENVVANVKKRSAKRRAAVKKAVKKVAAKVLPAKKKAVKKSAKKKPAKKKAAKK